MTQVEMGAQQHTYGRPAADAFDLPAALAARERQAAARRAAGDTGRGAAEDAGSDDLPQVFVPSLDR
jgi:hypothetical protein